MSLQGAMDIASGGLANVNLGLTLISQNVANASTPQYATEETTQQSLSAGGNEYGVQSLAPILATDPAVQAQLSSAVSQNTAAQTTSSALANIEPVLGTVGSGNDQGSLLTAVQTSFSTLLNDPSSATQQSAVVQSATTLAQGINTLAQTYSQARQNAQNALVSEVGELNTALGTIGTITTQIMGLQSLGQSTADLQNQLSQAENTVSTLIDARFITQPNGDVTVLTASGSQLPTHTPNPLSIASATTGPTASYTDGTLPGIMLGTTDFTSQLSGGSIGANITLRDQTLPTYQAALDEFSENLSNRFAAQGLTLFSNPTGTIPQSTTTPLQSGYVGYANTITVNPAIVTTPSLVRDGTTAIAGSPTGASAFTPNSTGLAGFNTLINRVLTYTFGSNVQDGVPQTPIATTGLGQNGTLTTGFTSQPTLIAYANALTSAQAADSANAASDASDAKGLQTSLQNTLTSATGVDMDTQLGQMVQLQNAYGANAKVITTIQAMFADALAMVQ
jgi:flagellar hook-associated protein 1 FlgK